ncbi:MAG: ketol-acid reductoisomerase [Leifsonia sp.]|nr:ketol-acid reductoisomerase [Leifsonia sp.]
MPFLTTAGVPLDALPLVYRRGRDFQVAEDFLYLNPRDGTRTLVPAHELDLPPRDGNSTDFASVPPFLWGLIANYGTQTLPAIMHDALVGQLLREPEEQRLALRRGADELFRVALIDNGVHRLRARVMWAAVGLESWGRHGGALGRLLIGQVAVGVLAIVAAVALGFAVSPWWFSLALAPLLLAAPWGSTFGLVSTATYLAALYAPLILGAFLASHVENAIAMIVWLATGCKGPRPRAEPTVAWKEEYAPESAAPRAR